MSSTATGGRRILALAALAAFIGVTNPGVAGAATVDANALAAARAAVDAFQTPDPDRWASFYAEDAVIEDFGSGKEGKRIEGRKAIVDWFKVFKDSWPDSTYKTLRFVAEGNTVVWEWRWEGTQVGGFLDAKASGRRLNLRGVTIWNLEGGKIQHEVTNYNYSMLLHQLDKD